MNRSLDGHALSASARGTAYLADGYDGIIFRLSACRVFDPRKRMSILQRLIAVIAKPNANRSAFRTFNRWFGHDVLSNRLPA